MRSGKYSHPALRRKVVDQTETLMRAKMDKSREKAKKRGNDNPDELNLALFAIWGEVLKYYVPSILVTWLVYLLVRWLLREDEPRKRA
jgi:hypothetical protein